LAVAGQPDAPGCARIYFDLLQGGSRQNPEKRRPPFPGGIPGITKSVWTFPAVSAEGRPPGAFPVALPTGQFQLYTYEGDLVLDPLWAAAAAIAALQANRRLPGLVESAYVRLAEKRIRQFKREVTAPQLFTSWPKILNPKKMFRWDCLHIFKKICDGGRCPLHRI
jgi:hypothetical protein